jgi:endonuclease/exonuclease/phosphatase (EEP) superfamily protein YafD
MPTTTPSSNRSFWSRLAIAFCLTHATGVLVFFALRTFLPRWPWPLALLNNFLPFLFAPLLLTLPFAWLTRSKKALIAALIPLSLFAAIYGPFFLPRLRPAAAPATEVLTVMSFNIYYNHRHPEQAIAAIEAEDADVVALQELTPLTAELLRQRLGGRYPYMILKPDVSSTGLLSRYPILYSEWFQPGDVGRQTILAVLDVNGRPVHVFAVHPPPPVLAHRQGRWLPVVPDGFSDEGSGRQVADIARRAAAIEGTVLVAGDFNMIDQTTAYSRMTSLLKDAFREAGWGFGFTFPHGERIGRLTLPGPLVRLDHLFHSDDLYAESARVRCAGGSNHCYLIVRLSRI